MVNRDFLARHPAEVAFDLIGCHLSVTRDGVTTGGRIVEVEAYSGLDDQASHSFRMKRPREVMSRRPGTIYVYLSYGIHTCLNFVSHSQGHTGGILIRAVEPTVGLDVIRERRGSVLDRQLARGPGNVGQALGVLLADIGDDLFDGDTFSLDSGSADQVWSSPRIGISKAVDHPWRYFDPTSKAVSAHRRGALTDLPTIHRTLRELSEPVE